jgi:ribosomal protein L16 Arg81 hydroxylase
MNNQNLIVEFPLPPLYYRNFKEENQIQPPIIPQNINHSEVYDQLYGGSFSEKTLTFIKKNDEIGYNEEFLKHSMKENAKIILQRSLQLLNLTSTEEQYIIDLKTQLDQSLRKFHELCSNYRQVEARFNLNLTLKKELDELKNLENNLDRYQLLCISCYNLTKASLI